MGSHGTHEGVCGLEEPQHQRGTALGPHRATSWRTNEGCGLGSKRCLPKKFSKLGFYDLDFGSHETPTKFFFILLAYNGYIE